MIKRQMFVVKVSLYVLQLRHRTMFYWRRANLKNNVKLKLDVTKNRYKIIIRAIETVKRYDTVNYIMVDINCWLKVVFKDGSGKLFTNNMSLKEILEKEGVNQVQYFDVYALQLY